jgi:glycosyltransferase involved in cell wall biosynthesis
LENNQKEFLNQLKNLMAINILQCIATNEPGGAEVVVRDLARLFSKDGFNTTVSVAGGGWIAEELGRSNVSYEVRPYKPFLDIRYMLHLIRLIRKNRIQIVHAHMSQMNLFCSLVGRLCRIPTIATIHGISNQFATKRQAAYCCIMERLASKVVLVSNHLLSLYDEAVGHPGAKRLAIYNGVDLAAFCGKEKSIRMEEPYKIVMVGSLLPIKDYLTMLEACKIMKAKGLRFSLKIVGDGPERKSLDGRIIDMGLEQEVEILGFRQDVSEILQSHDLYILSSTHEGFSISAIEAMATGLPVIATRCGGPEEIVVEGVTGMLVPPSDSKALAEAIQFITAHVETANAMGIAGRQRVEKEFSITKMQSCYAQLYRSLLPRHS